ncbi:MAG: hypothetical protein WD770_07400 [Actinomycetota bacterium]
MQPIESPSATGVDQVLSIFPENHAKNGQSYRGRKIVPARLA